MPGRIAKAIGYGVLVLIGIGIASHVWNRETVPERDRCNELATTQFIHRVAPSILRQTGNFGEKINPVVRGCKYFAKEDTLIVTMSLGWNGPLTGDYYQADGRLTINPPSAWEWETTGTNANLKGWELLKGLAGAIGEEVSKTRPSNAGFRFRFHNQCNRPVRLAIRFKDTRELWHTKGWWEFPPGENRVLSDAGNVSLTTSSSVWYYYAESADGSGLVWSGDHRVRYDDRLIAMKELKDDEGDSEWSVSCG